MAKASKEEWEKVMRWVNELENEIKYEQLTDKQLRELVERAPCLTRVVFGYQVMVDNCCDPDADTLEFNSKLKSAFAALERENRCDKDWVQIFQQIELDAAKESMTDVDTICAWHLGLAAWKAVKSAGAKFPHE